MNIILISSLLSAATFVFYVAASKESLEAGVSVRPPGSNIYLGECVLLQCTVESHCIFVRSYWWYRAKPFTLPNPRHLVSGDRYYITAVTREDADSYWCQVTCQGNETVLSVDARPVTLRVSDRPPPSLSLTPNTRHILRGEHFSIQCPASETSSSWKLLHFSPDRAVDTRVIAVQQSPPGDGVPADKSDMFVFVAASWSSGLYWCEGPEGRSNAVNVTVSYGNITLKTPAFPVAVGDDVVLHCQYQTGNHNKTRFFKNGAEIDTYSSASLDRVVEMTIPNVTQDDEGFYKCASHDRKMQSPESWLSVRADRGNFTSLQETLTSTSDPWKWITLSFGILLLFLIPLTVCLVWHYRYQMLCTRMCWPVCKHEIRAENLPATKQDATEVQWDLSWMEMSNLLDKDLYHGT